MPCKLDETILCRRRFPGSWSLLRSRTNTTFDSSETDIRIIQDYFGKTIGSTKKVLLQYGPNGRSRGIATITFGTPLGAAKAAKDLDGVKVDNRAMRV